MTCQKIQYQIVRLKKPAALIQIHMKSFHPCRSHRFRNVQAEVLYQRYFLRMNQNNMASLLGLLVIVSVTMIIVDNLSFPSASVPSAFTTDSNTTTSGADAAYYYLKPTSSSERHVDSAAILQGVVLGTFSVLYLVLLTLMTRAFALNEVYMIIFR